jgi:hypothetical protein
MRTKEQIIKEKHDLVIQEIQGETLQAFKDSIKKYPLRSGYERRHLKEAYQIGTTFFYIVGIQTELQDVPVRIIDAEGATVGNYITKEPKIQYKIIVQTQNNLYHSFHESQNIMVESGSSLIQEIENLYNSIINNGYIFM